MELDKIIDSVNGFVDRLQKAPLLIFCLAVVSHDIWRQLERDKKDERRDAMIEMANEKKDSAMRLLIQEQDEKLILKDSLMNMKERQMQDLINHLK